MIKVLAADFAVASVTKKKLRLGVCQSNNQKALIMSQMGNSESKSVDAKQESTQGTSQPSTEDPVFTDISVAAEEVPGADQPVPVAESTPIEEAEARSQECVGELKEEPKPAPPKVTHTIK